LANIQKIDRKSPNRSLVRSLIQNPNVFNPPHFVFGFRKTP